MPLQSPVLFLIFNRPDKTKQVFEAIRQAQPAKLFVAADGPRIDKKNEKELCEQTRDVIKQVNWPCEVKTLYRTENLGCKIAVSSAINWFFENVEEGIILEDDCLPNQSFFSFCQDMLTHYRDDERIMHIGGSNFQDGRVRGDGSYYFSFIYHIWGWATWKRAWKHYDIEMKNWEKFLNEGYLKSLFPELSHEQYFSDVFNTIKTNKLNTWDYQWVLSCWTNNGLSIIPNYNLVTNIGYDLDATHTSEGNDLSNRKLDNMIEAIQPSIILRNLFADKYTIDKYLIKKWQNKMMLSLKNVITK